MLDLAELGEVFLNFFVGNPGIDALEENLIIIVISADIEGLVCNLDSLELVKFFSCVTNTLQICGSASKYAQYLWGRPLILISGAFLPMYGSRAYKILCVSSLWLMDCWSNS